MKCGMCGDTRFQNNMPCPQCTPKIEKSTEWKQLQVIIHAHALIHQDWTPWKSRNGIVCGCGLFLPTESMEKFSPDVWAQIHRRHVSQCITHGVQTWQIAQKMIGRMTEEHGR